MPELSSLTSTIKQRLAALEDTNFVTDAEKTAIDGLGEGDKLLMTASERAVLASLSSGGSEEADPVEMPQAYWAIVAGNVNSKPAVRLFNVPDDIGEIQVQMGDTEQDWYTVATAPFDTDPDDGVDYQCDFTIPVGVVVKGWLKLIGPLGVGSSVTTYYKEVTLTADNTPVISVGTIGENVTTLSVPWATDTAAGTGYVLVDSNASRTGPQVAAGGGDYSASQAVTETGTQSPFTPSGLTANTSGYVHVVQVVDGEYSNVETYAYTTLETPSGTVVTTPAEFYAAISNGDRNILLPSGDKTVGDGWRHLMQSSPVKDFTGDPLTIQAQDPDNPPRFYSAQQNMQGCHYITWRNIAVENAGNMDKEYPGWFFDGGVNGGVSESCSNITLEFVTGTGPVPANLSDTTPDADWGDGLVRFSRFRNRNSHSNKIRYCTVENTYELCNGMNASGSWEVIGNVVRNWYFDVLRIMGCPAAYYVEGNALVAYNDFEDCIGRYNEITTSSPHPDLTQIFNSADGASPAVRNLLFYQNRLAPGALRGINVQAGLAQSKLINVGYVENVWCPRGNTHGISIEDGADGVLIERQTLCNSALGGGNTAIRVYDSIGQVMIKDTLFNTLTLGDDISPAQPNLGGFELDIINSPAGLDYSNFNGPGNPTGADALMLAMRPITDPSGRGALTTSGTFRNLPHVPMKAAAPALTPQGSGNVRIDTINEPTLMSPKQASQGGTTYTQADICWSTTGDGDDWTVVEDVEETDVLSSISTGTVYFRTRLHNSSGYGLWSEKKTLTVT